LKLHAIICQVLSRECFQAAALSPHMVSVSTQLSGLHREPDKLRQTLQEEIDKASGCGNDYILLAYGLCSRGTADLTARDTPIVIPKVHDCISLLLGSNARYQREFGEHPGTYYFSSGWIEYMDGELDQGMFTGKKEREYEERLREYTEKYGEDNAVYLLEQESQWLVNYSRAALIDLPLGDSEHYRWFTKDIAESRNWVYEELHGDLRLFEKLFNGDWDSSEFLIVQPGQRTLECVNSDIISAG